MQDWPVQHVMLLKRSVAKIAHLKSQHSKDMEHYKAKTHQVKLRYLKFICLLIIGLKSN